MKTTFGEAMTSFERENDERCWKNRFLKAVKTQDTSRLLDCIQEGLEEEYTFPVDLPLEVQNLISVYEKNLLHK